MKTKIIKIGNSSGILLSTHLLRQYKLEHEVEIVPKRDGILIKSTLPLPRADWEKRFEQSIKDGQQPDPELLEGFSNDFDAKDWKW